MKRTLIAMAAALLAVSPIIADDLPALPAPPQDQGLPYTRSARKAGLARIKDAIAVFAGSHYAYVRGYKVRLDQEDIRHGDAMLKEGRLLVPAAFAGVLDAHDFKPDPAPAYLEDKWVYTLKLPAVETRDVVQVEGKPYVDLASLAEAKGLKTALDPRGLLLIADKAITFPQADATMLDTVISLFDTPEKFADPDIATRYIPSLKHQGKWTDHVKVTPQQMAILDGPPARWTLTPKSEYDFTGFNASLLGSKTPPPGVYPRVLFSPGDVDKMAARIRSTKLGQMSLIEMDCLFKKSWWDPASSDGKIFQKLASGDLAGLEFTVPPGTSPNSYPPVFKGETPVIYNSHVGYVPECLTTMALYCLLTHDDAHGKQAAAAIVNYYKLREPLLDDMNAISDSELGSTFKGPDGTDVVSNGNAAATHWRSVAGIISHMNLGLALDFGGKWMDAAQKDAMRRIIAKATYGRRAYGQDGSPRFSDVNWVAWDLTNFLALAAIEGLPGYDPEAYDAAAETVRSWCEYGVDSSGIVYESTGKNPGALEFQVLSMVTMARRGENLWGHPHWRKFMEGQILNTSPTGKVTVNSGTQYSPFSQQNLSFAFTDIMKAFFPQDRKPDYLLSRAGLFNGKNDEGMREWMLEGFDADAFKQQVAKMPRLRLPSPTYPGFTHTVLYDADFQPTSRADLNLPLDLDDHVHGVFSSYSDATTNATWINMMVRPDHYLGAGHHHSDAGMFHFSGLGVDWFTQGPFDQSFEGKHYSLVQVDGHSEPDKSPGIGNAYNARARYLGAHITSAVSMASADLTEAYTYRWLTQPPQDWSPELQAAGWELDPNPETLKMFAGTSHEKMRFWWSNYNYSNYIATARSIFNPMKYVYRTTGLVRGAHPYGFISDELKKDDGEHLYQWIGMLNSGVWAANIPGLAPGQAVLACRGPASGKTSHGSDAITPANGEPLLLVCSLGLPDIKVENTAGPADRKGVIQYCDRMVIGSHSVEGTFHVLLIPFHMGEPLPRITCDAGRATIAWQGQTDTISFAKAGAGPGAIEIIRDGKSLLQP